MKKAVIATGGKQYLVEEGQELLVEKISSEKNKIELEPLLIIDDSDVKVGDPVVSGSKVVASILEAEVKAPKVKIMKFQAKKRVKTLRGHRQTHSRIKIDKIN